LNPSVLAIVCSIFGSPEKAEELLLAALALSFRRLGVGRSRGRGPPGGRGASIFLGGGDPFQPEIFVSSINFPAFFAKKKFSKRNEGNAVLRNRGG
jgi:hypothetical protein